MHNIRIELCAHSEFKMHNLVITDIDNAVIGDFPARLESQNVEGSRLLRTKV